MNLQLSSYSYLLIMILTFFLLPQGTSSSFRKESHLPSSLMAMKEENEQAQQEVRLKEIPVDVEKNCGDQTQYKPVKVPIPNDSSFSGCDIEQDRRSPMGRNELVGYSCTLMNSPKGTGSTKMVKVDYWCSEHPDCGTLTSDEKKDAPKSYFKGTIVVKVKKVESQQ